ncbi:YqaA family protein [Candidatus Paracaedibacter symbiosus]|uniref:YqaA family protein n=1 Tax=Candidatus Paracaedibacter symbiosus TaxID=244582 RepID=UPI0005094C67|nr:YqaA family protein [Candidatus Paracaedibacter symbiosus]
MNTQLTPRFYQWFLAKTQSPYATWLLNIVSFLESSVFPIPPDIMLIPMIIADRAKAWLLAFTCTVSSVVGGLVGYAIGFYLFETIGMWIIQKYSLESAFANFQTLFQEYGFWIILLKGATPIPYKLVAIAGGATGLSLWQFVLASIISRSIRFFMLATCFYFLGDKAKDFISKNLTLVFIGFFVTLFLGFLAFKLVF